MHPVIEVLIMMMLVVVTADWAVKLIEENYLVQYLC
jgi:hypothetical protein